jgi:hypothetical protein
MKKLIACLVFAAIAHTGLHAQNVSINNDGSTADPAAILDIKSNSKGLLVPRMTEFERIAINPAPRGLLVYQTDGLVPGFYYTSSPDPNFPNWYHLMNADEQYWKSIDGNHIHNSNSGKVGIGLFDPPHPFTVAANGIGIAQQTTAGTLQMGFFTSGTNAFLQTNTNHPLRFTTNNGATQMVLNTTGSVGIGNQAPDDAGLVVDKKIAGVHAIFGRNTSGVSIESSSPGIAFNSYSNAGRKTLATGYTGLLNLNPSSGALTLFTSNVSTAADATTTALPRLLIDKDGNIGVQGNTLPVMPFSFSNAIGNKISLHGTSATGHYGLGVQSSLLQMYTSQALADIAFGYGSSTNFTENVRMKGDGKVGINTSTPVDMLTVSSNGRGITQQSTDGAVRLGFYTTPFSAYVQTNTSHPLNFATNGGGTQMLLSTAGNLGIGNIDPVHKLDVTGRMRLRYGGVSAGIWLNKQDNSDEALFTGNYNDTMYGIFNNANSQGWQFFFDHKNARMGIDVSNPKVALSFPGIAGKKISLFPGNTGDVGMGVFASEFRLHSDQASADITFGHDNYTNGFTERMRVKGDGRVCIGTTSPATGYLLSVNGKVIAQEVRVQHKTNWPDYVFNKDYKRMSLGELETYVNVNKHLPGFEPAAVVEKEGADVGEIQRRLLEKVEELTLHLIDVNNRMVDMNKNIAKLQEENTILKSKISKP